jgi:hypothetical protein
MPSLRAPFRGIRPGRTQRRWLLVQMPSCDANGVLATNHSRTSRNLDAPVGDVLCSGHHLLALTLLGSP